MHQCSLEAKFTIFSKFQYLVLQGIQKYLYLCNTIVESGGFGTDFTDKTRVLTFRI